MGFGGKRRIGESRFIKFKVVEAPCFGDPEVELNSNIKSSVASCFATSLRDRFTLSFHYAGEFPNGSLPTSNHFETPPPELS